MTLLFLEETIYFHSCISADSSDSYNYCSICLHSAWEMLSPIHRFWPILGYPQMDLNLTVQTPRSWVNIVHITRMQYKQKWFKKF